tara:strand:+ start:236 stop:427 length:192 start_codon:yes stop_codon:yes gene_type:complete
MITIIKKIIRWFVNYHDVQNDLTRQGIYMIPTYGIHGVITYIDKERQEEYWQKIKEQTKNESN